MIGSKIDWSHVPFSISKRIEIGNDKNNEFIQFFDSITNKLNFLDNTIYINDSAINIALKGTIESIRTIMPELLNISQHHYFINIGCDWCFSLTMEGYMDFGFSVNSDAKYSKAKETVGKLNASMF